MIGYPEWQLVPKEPTQEMMDDAFDNISLSDAHTEYGVTEHVWAYMLKHAPKPPVIEEASWIKNLREELMMSKITHNFTLSRNELMTLLGM